MITSTDPNTNALAVLRSILGGKVVSYHSVFARALRNVPAAVMLSQAFFWQENALHKDLVEFDGKPHFTKTAAEWYEATGVSDETQVTARELLKYAQILHEKRAGVPARLYFHIDIDALVSVIYGYLNSGIQVSVDNRSKKRDYTVASNGKFRKQDSVIYGTTYRKESTIESFESSVREARAQKKSATPSKKEKEKKAPQVPAAPPTLFVNSAWATTTATAWCDALQALCLDLPADLDTDYYLGRCRNWSAEKGGTSADWLATGSRFAHDDFKQQKLVTLQPIPSHASPNSSTTNNRDTSGYEGLIQRGVERAERYRKRNAVSGNQP